MNYSGFLKSSLVLTKPIVKGLFNEIHRGKELPEYGVTGLILTLCYFFVFTALGVEGLPYITKIAGVNTAVKALFILYFFLTLLMFSEYQKQLFDTENGLRLMLSPLSGRQFGAAICVSAALPAIRAGIFTLWAASLNMFALDLIGVRGICFLMASLLLGLVLSAAIPVLAFIGQVTKKVYERSPLIFLVFCLVSTGRPIWQLITADYSISSILFASPAEASCQTPWGCASVFVTDPTIGDFSMLLAWGFIPTLLVIFFGFKVFNFLYRLPPVAPTNKLGPVSSLFSTLLCKARLHPVVRKDILDCLRSQIGVWSYLTVIILSIGFLLILPAIYYEFDGVKVMAINFSIKHHLASPANFYNFMNQQGLIHTRRAVLISMDRYPAMPLFIFGMMLGTMPLSRNMNILWYLRITPNTFFDILLQFIGLYFVQACLCIIPLTLFYMLPLDTGYTPKIVGLLLSIPLVMSVCVITVSAGVFAPIKKDESSNDSFPFIPPIVSLPVVLGTYYLHNWILGALVDIRPIIGSTLTTGICINTLYIFTVLLLVHGALAVGAIIAACARVIRLDETH